MESAVEAPSSGWDAWLAAHGGESGFCQTSAWAAIHKAANGAESFVVTVEDGGRLRAGASISRRPADLSGVSLPTRVRAWIGGAGRGRLECFEGPVLVGPDKPALLGVILGQVEALRARLGVREVRFAGAPPASMWAADEVLAAVFERFGYEKTAWLTAFVDLTRSEEELSKSFRHAARKGIRKCLEAGVTVNHCRDFDEFFRDFFRPYYSAARNDVALDRLKERAGRSWEINGCRHYRFFVAKNTDGGVLATLGTYSFNGLATEIMSARMALASVLKLPAQDLLHWEVFRAHKAVGDRLFNLAGFSPDPQTPKEVGIRRFKEKWGGRVVEVPRFHKTTLSPPVRLVRGISRAIRRLST